MIAPPGHQRSGADQFWCEPGTGGARLGSESRAESPGDADPISPRFGTPNVYLASFLRASGAILLAIERIDGHQFRYCFVADVRLRGLVRLYWSERPVAIAPLALFGALRRLTLLARRLPGRGRPRPPRGLGQPPLGLC